MNVISRVTATLHLVPKIALSFCGTGMLVVRYADLFFLLIFLLYLQHELLFIIDDFSGIMKSQWVPICTNAYLLRR